MLKDHYSVKKPVELVTLHTLIIHKKDKNFYFSGESHPFWEFVYVANGSVGITADDRVYTLSAGDAVFHKPMEFHRIWSSQGTSPLVYIFSFTANGEYMSKLECKTTKTDAYSKELIEKAVECGAKAFNFRGALGILIDSVKDNEKALAFVNLMEMFLCHCAENTKSIAALNDRDALLFENAVATLQKNIENKMTVEQLAESCFVSASKIKKLFAKYAGKGVSEYFTEMKIKEARRFLRKGKLLLKQGNFLAFPASFIFLPCLKR